MGYRDTVVLVGSTGIGRARWTRDELEGGWQHHNLLCFYHFDVSFTKLI